MAKKANVVYGSVKVYAPHLGETWEVECPNGVGYTTDFDSLEKRCKGRTQDVVRTNFRGTISFNSQDLFDSKDLAIALGASTDINSGSNYDRTIGPGQGNDSDLGDARAEWHLVRLGSASGPFTNSEAFRLNRQEIDTSTTDWYLGAESTGTSTVSPYSNSSNELHVNDEELGTVDIDSLAGGDINEITYDPSKNYRIQGADPIMPHERGEQPLLDGETVGLIGATYEWGSDVIDTSSGSAIADANRTAIIDQFQNQINYLGFRIEARPSSNSDNEVMIIRIPRAAKLEGVDLNFPAEPNSINGMDIAYSNLSLPNEDEMPQGVIEIVRDDSGVTLT